MQNICGDDVRAKLKGALVDCGPQMAGRYGSVTHLVVKSVNINISLVWSWSVNVYVCIILAKYPRATGWILLTFLESKN